MCFGERIRVLDIFGAQVGLTYKGSVKFKTRVGGAICLIIIIVMGQCIIIFLFFHCFLHGGRSSIIVDVFVQEGIVVTNCSKFFANYSKFFVIFLFELSHNKNSF